MSLFIHFCMEQTIGFIVIGCCRDKWFQKLTGEVEKCTENDSAQRCHFWLKRSLRRKLLEGAEHSGRAWHHLLGYTVFPRHQLLSLLQNLFGLVSLDAS